MGKFPNSRRLPMHRQGSCWAFWQHEASKPRKRLSLDLGAIDSHADADNDPDPVPDRRTLLVTTTHMPMFLGKIVIWQVSEMCQARMRVCGTGGRVHHVPDEHRAAARRHTGIDPHHHPLCVNSFCSDRAVCRQWLPCIYAGHSFWIMSQNQTEALT